MQIQELFLMVVDLPAAERVIRLDSLCAHDGELRAEVESLLASDGGSGETIAQAMQMEASLLLDLELVVDKRVGAYRIVREIGRGGMGVVYLATRDDEVYQKQVAVKVVKPGMDTAEVLDRFRYERQILASLEHPYIARLFDGGSTDEGLPFFVMEYVEGQPVNVFCRGNTLSNRDRCELFLKILEAVSYAHRNLVVHRDLKPGNIFVTREGSPKLLDFGVAKLISGNGEGSQTITTLLRPFTPEYASPEQVRGLPVTTSTDIYSLGAVFYELLTDRRAQPILTSTPSGIERAVCEVEPQRPSHVAPSVDEDLDNIVLMAMRKEPERRYHSVDQFVEDIERYLDGRPILARQASMSYRLRKFLLRNRLELATVTVLILGLSGGLAVSLLQTRRAGEALRQAEAQRVVAVRENARAAAETHKSEQALASEARQKEIAEQETSIAEQERDIAQRETSVAERRVGDMIDLADSALFGVYDEVMKLSGSVAARKKIVQSTLNFLERLEQENGLDDRTRMILSSGYVKLATLQGSFYTPSLQDFAGAESSLLKAKAIIMPLYLSHGNDPKVLDRYLEIEIGLADQATQKDQQAEAIALFTEMLPVVRQLAQIAPCDVDCGRKEPALEGRIAKAYIKLDDPRGVEHANRRVALTREFVARYRKREEDLNREPAYALQTAAEALISAGDLEAAADDYRESVQILEKVLLRDPADPFAHRSLIASYEGYAAVLGVSSAPNLHRPTEALQIAEKAVTMARESVEKDSQDATARYDLAVALVTKGSVPPPADGIEASLASLKEAADLLSPIVKGNPNTTSKVIQLAIALQFMGQRLEALGRRPEAIDNYQKSLALLDPLLVPGSRATIVQSLATEESLALAYASSDRERSAGLDSANRAVTRAEKLKAASPQNERNAGDLAAAFAALAIVQQKCGDAAEAQQSAEKALALWKQVTNRGVVSIHAEAMANAENLLTIADHAAQIQ